MLGCDALRSLVAAVGQGLFLAGVGRVLVYGLVFGEFNLQLGVLDAQTGLFFQQRVQLFAQYHVFVAVVDVV